MKERFIHRRQPRLERSRSERPFRTSFLTFLLLLLGFIAGCSSPEPLRPNDFIPPPQSSPIDSNKSREAPWSLSRQPAVQAHPLIQEAVRAEEARDILVALQRYEQAQRESGSIEDRQFALERRTDILLKYGRSADVLQELSQFAAKEGLAEERLSASLALIAAYAYQHQRDIDQTLAWLSNAHRLSGGSGLVSERARSEAARLVRKIRDQAFEDYVSRWKADRFVSSIIASDRARRARKVPAPSSDREPSFDPIFYGLPGSLPLFEPTPAPTPDPASQPGAPNLGVVLPLTGTYSEHATKVLNGIQLACEPSSVPDSPPRARVVVADNAGDPVRAADEYTRLINSESVNFVLGPLLVRSAEEVATRSQSARVPFLTFTKREGITSLSPYSLRLGATAFDQVQDFLAFATREKGWSKVTLVGASRSIEEFERSFRSTSEGANMLQNVITVEANENQSAAVVIDQLQQSIPDVVFFVDAPNQISAILTQMQSHPQLGSVARFGAASWHDPVVLRALRVLVDGSYYVTPFLASSSRPNVQRFSEQYRARFASEPDLLAAQGYDAATLALTLLDGTADISHGSTELRRRRSILGVTGELTVLDNGEIRRRMSVVGIQGGDLLELTFGGVPTGAALPSAMVR